MFDKWITVHQARPQHVHQSVEVHEHRAATDQSVALLREMEEAAAARVLKCIVADAGPNTLGAVIIETAINAENYKRMVHVAFDLNGEIFKVRIAIGDLKNQENNARAMGDAVAKAIAQKIAVQFMVKNMVRCPS